MDDMTTFERQVADEMQHRAGPDPAVDDVAIFAAITATTTSPRWRFQTMFSATKFVVAGAIVALFGGFLLAGVLTTQQGDEAAPGAVTESLPPEESDAPVFPIGAFVSEENYDVLLEFNEDGTGVAREAQWGNDVDPTFIYATRGDVYTEMMHFNEQTQRQVPATYYWDFDGQHLSFELWGEDEVTWRRPRYEDNTWRLIEDPRIVVVAATDIEAGEPMPYWMVELGFMPAVEVGADEYTDPEVFTERVPLAPIPKGRPITPDLFEPVSE